MESNNQYRAEKPGEVGGLYRVYAITVEDGHSFCRLDQVENEIINIINIIKDFYSALGLWGKHWISLSVRDPKHLDDYIGEEKDWNKCERILQKISNKMSLKAKRCEGEAAYYGPKLDFIFQDALGREVQIPTVQLDFAMPKRFNLVYTDEKGKDEHPIMVHRAILGSYERFLMLLIEHFAGAFPVWLSPVQVVIIPVSNKFNAYAKKVNADLLENNIRVELNNKDETLGKRISESEKQKIPYMLVVGEKEVKSKNVTVRRHNNKRLEKISIKKFIEKVKKEIETKK